MGLFTGLSAFPPTPMDDRGRLDSDGLGQILERIVQAGVASIGLLGSTGGYAYLTPEERKRVLRVAAECVGERIPIIVGVGAIRTDMAEDLARDARHAGAAGLLLAPVSYQALTDEEVFRHFEAVAQTGELPLCIYNNPRTTNFSFSTELIGRLAELSEVEAVKMPPLKDGDYAGQLARLQAVTPEGFSVGHSGDWDGKEALLAGTVCWYSVIAGLLPAETLALARAAQAGNNAEAERLDRAFRPFWQLFQRHGSYRVMFSLATLLGHDLQPPRPVLPLAAEEQAAVRAALATFKGLSLPDAGRAE